MVDDLDFRLRLVKTAEQAVESLDKMYEITHKLESENATRMAWLVGISGFAILNLPNVFSKELPPSFLDFVPWLVTTVLGVVAHWSHRNLDVHNFELYATKRESLLTFITNGVEYAILINLQEILLNKTEKLQKIGKALSRATSIATRFEQLAFLSFVVSLMYFVWEFVQQSL